MGAGLLLYFATSAINSIIIAYSIHLLFIFKVRVHVNCDEVKAQTLVKANHTL
jgi:hypothetical protein